MKLSNFIKDKFVFICFQGFIIVFIYVLLSVFKINFSLKILCCSCVIVFLIFSLFYEYIIRSRYYSRVYNILDNMDKKQYIVSLLDQPDFSDGVILYDILKQSTKAMNDEIAKHKHISQEYREYIETWIHEIKIPISVVSLICENNDNETTKDIMHELGRIDSYVEQALFYARSTNLEKDYCVRKIQLNTIVKSVLKKYSKQLISCKTEINFRHLDFEVYSDPKWIEFILGQIISNSIKYRNGNLVLTFCAAEEDQKIILSINDNGVGIAEKDISRVLEKGFTGENGRQFAKSTGIGLYLCNQLCEKMNLKVLVKSKIGFGTTISIVFPKDKSRVLE